MTIDTERQRAILLQMIEDMNIPGKLLDEIVALRQAIRSATVAEPPKSPPASPTA